MVHDDFLVLLSCWQWKLWRRWPSWNPASAKERLSSLERIWSEEASISSVGLILLFNHSSLCCCYFDFGGFDEKFRSSEFSVRETLSILFVSGSLNELSLSLDDFSRKRGQFTRIKNPNFRTLFPIFTCEAHIEIP